MPGNPVRIGDGCATVTGYKLPKPLFAQRAWEGGSEIGGPKSGYRFSCARRDHLGMVNFSVKEKDETSLPNRFWRLR